MRTDSHPGPAPGTQKLRVIPDSIRDLKTEKSEMKIEIENNKQIKNQNIMKKYMMLAAVAALTLASCAKIETLNTKPVVDENIPISFTNYAPKAITKAASSSYVSSNALVNPSAFGVYAWAVANTTYDDSTSPYGNATFDGTGNATFMNNVKVTYKGDTTDGDGNVSSAGYYSEGQAVRYWPSGDTPAGLSFFAYYPFAEGSNGITASTQGLNTDFTFVAKTTDSEMVDFLVSEVVANQYFNHTNSGYNGTVSLPFKHQLTKVSFKFKKTDVAAKVIITGVELNGIKNTNTLSATYNGTATTIAWKEDASHPSGAVTYTVAHPTTELTTTAAPATVADANLFLMVPQDMAANVQKIKITWTVQTGSEAVVTNTKTFDLRNITTDGLAPSTSNVVNWEANHQVEYTITVGPNPIYFTASVTPWTTPVVGGSTTVN